MNYIDTDVLIHSLVNQNTTLHLEIIGLIEEMVFKDQFLISLLSIQETGFVLSKLKQSASSITSNLNALISLSPVEYGLLETERAMELAVIIGYKNFNDCLHTAIAERHCTDLFTCNYKDFKLIQPHTSLKIHYLQ